LLLLVNSWHYTLLVVYARNECEQYLTECTVNVIELYWAG